MVDGEVVYGPGDVDAQPFRAVEEEGVVWGSVFRCVGTLRLIFSRASRLSA